MFLPLLTLLLLQAPAPYAPAAVRDDTPPTERQQLQAHLKVVRDGRLAVHEKEAAMEALLGLGVPGRLALARQAQDEAEDLLKGFRKERGKLVGRFESEARRVPKERLGREEWAEVEELRAASLAASRDRGLTKDTVRSVCDPALRRLEDLLTVDPDELWELDEELAERHDAAVGLLDDARVFAAFQARALTALDGDPEGQRHARRIERIEDVDALEHDLFAELHLAARLAMPMSDADRQTLKHNADLVDELLPEEVLGIARLNEIRICLGLPALRVDVRLCAASRDHSKDMVELGFFSHTSPVAGKESFGQRAANFGTSARAENIAAGQNTGAGAIEAWWYSPGHHRNMLGGHGRIGLGRHASMWTQMFG